MPTTDNTEPAGPGTDITETVTELWLETSSTETAVPAELVQSQPAKLNNIMTGIAEMMVGEMLLAENVPEKDLFPEGMVVDNSDDMQIVVDDEPVPLAAFSDMVEPGIIMRWLDIFLVLAVLGLLRYYLLPARRRRKEEES